MKKQSTINRYAAIAAYYQNLIHIERRRFDDAVEETAQYFFCASSTVMRAIRLAKTA
jgi:hypothetical protein